MSFDISTVNFDKGAGLVPAIVQDADSGAVLLVTQAARIAALEPGDAACPIVTEEEPDGADPLPPSGADPDALRPLARRMGYEGGAGPRQLLNHLRTRREAIRAAFDSCVAREQSRTAAVTQTPA